MLLFLLGALSWADPSDASSSEAVSSENPVDTALSEPMPVAATERPVVIFVHGMFMTGHSWAAWETWFQERGYDTIAPSWPGREGTPAALRQDPPDTLRETTFTDVVDAMEAEIAALGDRPKLLVGHSMGGLVVEHLLQRDAALAGVAIDAAPPKGVSSSRLSFLRSNFHVLLPTRKPLNPTLKWFRYAFAHTLPDDVTAAAFETEVVPESRRVGRGPTRKESKIDFRAEHPPLLLVAGDADHIIPPSLVDKVYRQYQKGPSVTELQHFDGRVHWICAEPGWEEVATASEAFLREHLDAAR